MEPDPSRTGPADNLVHKDARVRGAWAAFCRAHAVDEATPYQAWYFGNSAELAHELMDLVVHGPKRGTAGLQWSIERHPDLAPVPHGYSVVCEYDGTPRAVLRTTDIQVKPFAQVDAQFAWDEGEGDRSLAYWKKAHWEYFSAECASLGREPSLEMPVVLERFELLWVVPESR